VREGNPNNAGRKTAHNTVKYAIFFIDYLPYRVLYRSNNGKSDVLFLSSTTSPIRRSDSILTMIDSSRLVTGNEWVTGLLMAGIVGNKSAARGLSNSGESKTTSNKDNRNRRRHHELRDLQSNSKTRPPQVSPRIVVLHRQSDAASSKARSHGRADDPSA